MSKASCSFHTMEQKFTADPNLIMCTYSMEHTSYPLLCCDRESDNA